MTAPSIQATPGGGHFGSVTVAFAGRALVRMMRVPSIVLPMVVMPVFFVVAFTGSFSAVVQIDGYGTDKAVNWMVAWAVLQGSSFSGMGAAGAAATDIENGFFDRIRLAPIPSLTVIAGLLMYGLTRAVLPITAVLFVAFAFLDADLPGGFPGLVMVYVAGFGMALVMSLLALGVVFTFKTLQSLGLANVLIFTLMFLSVGQAPLVAIEGWMHDIAAINPVTPVIRLCRQGFLGPVTWEVTGPGLLSLAGMIAFFGTIAVWRYRKIT